MNLLFVFVSPMFMCLSLYVAFGKKFRPITWKAFYGNLGAAAINFIATLVNLYAYLNTVPQ